MPRHGLGQPGPPCAGPQTQPDEAQSDGAQCQGAEPDHRQGIEPQRRADGHEEDHEHRRRTAADRRAQRVTLRDREVLDGDARRQRRDQRLQLLRRPDLAEDAAHPQQHEGNLTADVAQVEREQDADEHTERHRAADLPRQARQHVGALVRSRVERDTGHLHRDREQDQHHEIGEHDDRQHRVAQPSPRSRVRHDGGGHGRRERHDHDAQQGQHDQTLCAARVGRNGQPRPRDPGHGGYADHSDDHGDDGRPCDRAQPGSQAFDAQRQAGDEGDQRRRQSRDHLELASHRLRDQIAERRARRRRRRRGIP